MSPLFNRAMLDLKLMRHLKKIGFTLKAPLIQIRKVLPFSPRKTKTKKAKHLGKMMLYQKVGQRPKDQQESFLWIDFIKLVIN